LKLHRPHIVSFLRPGSNQAEASSLASKLILIKPENVAPLVFATILPLFMISSGSEMVIFAIPYRYNNGYLSYVKSILIDDKLKKFGTFNSTISIY